MVSEQAKNYTFPEGEYKNCIAYEMLNHYLVIQYMAHELSRNYGTDDERKIYKELIEYAKTKYTWVDLVIKNAGYVE